MSELFGKGFSINPLFPGVFEVFGTIRKEKWWAQLDSNQRPKDYEFHVQAFYLLLLPSM